MNHSRSAALAVSQHSSKQDTIIPFRHDMSGLRYCLCKTEMEGSSHEKQ